MSERAGGSPVELTFLALSGADYEIGIAADRVREVVAASTWSGAPPLDLAALIPALGGGDAAPRVLAVGLAAGQLLSLHTTATISVRTVDAAALWILPRVVTRRARWIRGVVFATDGAALVVVDPDGIADGATADAAAPAHRSLPELW